MRIGPQAKASDKKNWRLHVMEYPIAQVPLTQLTGQRPVCVPSAPTPTSAGWPISSLPRPLPARRPAVACSARDPHIAAAIVAGAGAVEMNILTAIGATAVDRASH